MLHLHDNTCDNHHRQPTAPSTRHPYSLARNVSGCSVTKFLCSASLPPRQHLAIAARPIITDTWHACPGSDQQGGGGRKRRRTRTATRTVTSVGKTKITLHDFLFGDCQFSHYTTRSLQIFFTRLGFFFTKKCDLIWITLTGPSRITALHYTLSRPVFITNHMKLRYTFLTR